MLKSKTDQLVEDLEPKIKTRKGGTMKKPSKQSVETFKTVVIVALVTAVIAFVAGIKYQQKYSESVKSEAKELSSVVSRVDSKK